jgi:hypothetical protein
MKTSAVMALAALAASATLAHPAAAAGSCNLLTPADVLSASGAHVTAVPFMSKPGAGGKCVNFANEKGRLFLGVSALGSVAEYRQAVASVPTSVYPTRTALTGVGDEGVLMKGSGGLVRYLVARKGNHGVIMFPFGREPTDAQLEKLAVIALSR